MTINPREKASVRFSQHPGFFVVVSCPFAQDQKIPYVFMTEYGRELQKMVSLKVPTGDSWQVEVFHCDDGRTLLKNGWKEFSEFYYIEKFYLLLFNYRGNSQFDVFIYDLSATEIEYRVKTGREGISEKQNRKTQAACKGKKPLAVENLEEDVYIEISDDDLPEPSSREVPREHARVKGKKNRLKFQLYLAKGKGKRNDDGKSKGTIRDKSKFKSYEKAKAFTSSKPFFISFMQPSFVSKKFYLEIPKHFVAEHLYENRKRDNFRLHVSGSTKYWDVTVFFPDCETPPGRIVIGWNFFVKDHGLRIGDVCVFELVPGTKNMIVTIYYSEVEFVSE